MSKLYYFWSDKKGSQENHYSSMRTGKYGYSNKKWAEILFRWNKDFEKIYCMAENGRKVYEFSRSEIFGKGE